MVILRAIRNHVFRNFLNPGKCLEDAALQRLFLNNLIAKNNARSMAVYESEPKTVGTVLNKKTSKVILINNYLPEGFVLHSGDMYVGSMVVLPHAIFSWNVQEAKDVTEESLILFKLLEPKIDILIFGYGNSKDYTFDVRQNFTKICKKLGLRYEALPTDKAVGTYNFLADERRLVGGAFIPPKFIDILKFERKKMLYLEDGEDDDDELLGIEGGRDDKKLIK